MFCVSVNDLSFSLLSFSSSRVALRLHACLISFFYVVCQVPGIPVDDRDWTTCFAKHNAAADKRQEGHNKAHHDYSRSLRMASVGRHLCCSWKRRRKGRSA